MGKILFLQSSRLDWIRLDILSLKDSHNLTFSLVPTKLYFLIIVYGSNYNM